MRAYGYQDALLADLEPGQYEFMKEAGHLQAIPQTNQRGCRFLRGAGCPRPRGKLTARPVLCARPGMEANFLLADELDTRRAKLPRRTKDQREF